MPKRKYTRRKSTPEIDRQRALEDAMLTPQVRSTILNALRIGNYLETAASLAGITKKVFDRWMQQGAAETVGYWRDFYDEVAQALAAAEAADLAIIKKASQTQWQAAAWRLERRYKDRWGRNTLEVTGKNGGPITQDHGAIVGLIAKIYGVKVADVGKKTKTEETPE